MTNSGESSKESLTQAIQIESRKFQEYYLWLEKSMPPVFFEEVSKEKSEGKLLVGQSNSYEFPLGATVHLKADLGSSTQIELPKEETLDIKNYESTSITTINPNLKSITCSGTTIIRFKCELKN